MTSLSMLASPYNLNSQWGSNYGYSSTGMLDNLFGGDSTYASIMGTTNSFASSGIPGLDSLFGSSSGSNGLNSLYSGDTQAQQPQQIMQQLTQFMAQFMQKFLQMLGIDASASAAVAGNGSAAASAAASGNGSAAASAASGNGSAAASAADSREGASATAAARSGSNASNRVIANRSSSAAGASASAAAKMGDGGGDGGDDPYEVNINGEKYIFVKDKNGNGKTDGTNELLGISDTKDNLFGEMKELDSNHDGKVDKTEMDKAGVKLAKVGADGKIDDSQTKGVQSVDLASFQANQAFNGKLGEAGQFNVNLSDGSSVQGKEMFETIQELQRLVGV